MSLDDLDRWRKKAPIFIFTACAIPWVFIKARSGDQFRLYYDTLIPVVAAILFFFYIGLNVRGVLWDYEMETHVRTQIRKAIVDLVPEDLAITDSEKRRLLEKEIYKKLAGVFWETVDASPQLHGQKQHFYSNGLVYSTSFDVYIICGLSAIFFYCNAALATGRIEFGYVAAGLFGIANLAIIFVMPRARLRHLQLSAEQLALIRREHSASVAAKFRVIINDWRRSKDGK